MAKQDPQDILTEAKRLHDERFGTRITQLKHRAAERFNQTVVSIPSAYQKATNAQPDGKGGYVVGHSSNIIDDEGRQIATLVYSMPTPHIPSPSPELQELTTTNERFVMAMHQELEDKNGPVWWQCTLAQVHDNIGWLYFAPKKVAYKGQPQAPSDDAPQEERDDYAVRNERYKRDAGISAVFDYEFATTATVFPDGNVYDPHCVYVWKEVPESTLRKRYGVYRNRRGSFEKISVEAGSPTGYPADEGQQETMIAIVEYWDRDYCCIVAEETEDKFLRGRRVKGAYLLDEWEHNFGRVPYFARPAFVTEQLDEDKKFSGPLDGIHNEIPSHKRLRTMADAVSYQTAFSPLQIVTKEQGETIPDSNGQPLTFLELEPGKARQMAPGQQIMTIPQSPEVANLFQELAASLQRIERYTLSPVAKGVSPGADTANAALSNLHRFQLSTLDPMAQQIGRQGRAMYRFALEQIRKMEETVYVLDRKTDAYLSLNADEIISVNVQAKAVPDQGQLKLLIQKHAMELWLGRAISRTEMYEMMGYENPEEKAREVEIEDFAITLKPVVLQQVTAALGLLDAINRMIQSNAQGGSAKDAIPQIMDDARGAQEGALPSGMGQGSGGQPRSPGVRASATDVNTQEGQALGVGY